MQPPGFALRCSGTGDCLQTGRLTAPQQLSLPPKQWDGLQGLRHKVRHTKRVADN